MFDPMKLICRRSVKAFGLVVAIVMMAGGEVAAEDPDKALPIIPGAAGFGMETPAGSGRHLAQPQTQVIKVTNLNTEGPGSLRAALEAEGPRVVVFEVSGNIDFTPIGNLSINKSYVTIAGQTAPSPGITLKGCQLHIRTHDVLLQHIRIRTGDLSKSDKVDKNAAGWTEFSERDCMKVGGERIVIDHCSFSWSTDENVQSRANDATFHRNIFSEGLQSSKHHKGGHSRGLLIMNQGPKTGSDSRKEGQRIAVLGNLFVHNKGRNPTLNGGATGVVANNLIHGSNFAMKVDERANRSPSLVSFQANVVERTNYAVVARAMHADSRYYVGTDNIFKGKQFDNMANAWRHVSQPFKPGVAEKHRVAEPPIVVPGYEVKPAEDVKKLALRFAGARPADRDPVDQRIVRDVVEGTGKIIASQEDVGGWPDLEENRRKLTVPDNPHGDDDGDGYTNLEEWLHAFAAEVERKDP